MSLKSTGKGLPFEGRGNDQRQISESLSVQIVDDSIRFGCLREEWEQVVEKAPVSPFQTFDWSYLWWRHFGGASSRTLHVILFRNGDDLVGIAPLFLETVRLAGKPVYRRLRFLGCDVPDSPVSPFYATYPLTDYFDFIVSPGFEPAVAEAWTEYLQTHRNLCDVVELVNVQKTGFVLKALLSRIPETEWQHRIHRSEPCPRILPGGSFEEYLQTLDGNHRRRLRQAKKAHEEQDWFSMEQPESQGDLRKALGELVRLHQRRWNKMGSPGLFYDKRFEMFQADLMDSFHSRGWLWMKAVRARGTIIAVRLCFHFKGVLYDYLSGVDDEVEEAKRRPGLALLVEAIQECIRQTGRAVDLLRGGEQYKMQIANDIQYVWEVTLLKPQGESFWRQQALKLWHYSARNVHRVMRERLKLKIYFHEYGIQGIMKYIKERSNSIMKKLQFDNRNNGSSHLKYVEEVVRRPLERVRDRAPIAQRILNSLQRDEELPLTRKIFKAIVYLRSLALSRLYLVNCDHVGKRCRTRGKPFIVNDGRISIGNDFNLSSRIVRSELATGHKGSIEIGDDVSINFGGLISSQQSVKIGNNVRIGPYAIITDSDFHTIGQPYSPPTGVPTVIEDNVWLGARVTVLKGSAIGAGSVISAGSLVAGIIPPNVIAAGVPARVIRPARSASSDGNSKKRSNGSEDSEVTGRVKKVFIETFGLDAPPELSWGPHRIARWDSLGHMNLILNLEAEFRISIPEEDLLKLTTVQDACSIMGRHTESRTKTAAGLPEKP